MRKVLFDLKPPAAALPVSTLDPGSYTLIQSRMIIESGAHDDDDDDNDGNDDDDHAHDDDDKFNFTRHRDNDARCGLQWRWWNRGDKYFIIVSIVIFITTIIIMLIIMMMCRFYKWPPCQDQRLNKGRCCSR